MLNMRMEKIVRIHVHIYLRMRMVRIFRDNPQAHGQHYFIPLLYDPHLRDWIVCYHVGNVLACEK